MRNAFEIRTPDHVEGEACDRYDRYQGRAHVHCASCADVLKIEAEGPDPSEYAIIDGRRCPECREPACSDCMTIADGITMCRACAEHGDDARREAANVVQCAIEAKNAIDAYLQALRVETNPVAMLETRNDLDAMAKTLATIQREFAPHINRCYSAAPLPGCAA